MVASEALGDDSVERMGEFEYIRQYWDDFIRFCRGSEWKVDALLRRACKPISVEGNTLVLGFRVDGFQKRNLEKPNYRRTLEENLERMFGKRYSVRYVVIGEEENYD